jgi:hypothetical protein
MPKQDYTPAVKRTHQLKPRLFVLCNLQLGPDHWLSRHLRWCPGPMVADPHVEAVAVTSHAHPSAQTTTTEVGTWTRASLPNYRTCLIWFTCTRSQLSWRSCHAFAHCCSAGSKSAAIGALRLSGFPRQLENERARRSS